MAYWQEIGLKGLVLLATVASVIGSLVLLLVGIMANGSAISDAEFSWVTSVIIWGIVGNQVWLIVAGCRSGWRWIDRWSEEIAEDQR